MHANRYWRDELRQQVALCNETAGIENRALENYYRECAAAGSSPISMVRTQGYTKKRVPPPPPPSSYQTSRNNEWGAMSMRQQLEQLKQAEADIRVQRERLEACAAASNEHHRATLVTLLRQYAPHRLHGVSALLLKNNGNENVMFSDLLHEFGATSPPPMWKEAFTNFYKEVNPEKLPEVDTILHLARGREGRVFEELKKKYRGGIEPTNLTDESSVGLTAVAAAIGCVRCDDDDENKVSAGERRVSFSPSPSPPPPPPGSPGYSSPAFSASPPLDSDTSASPTASPPGSPPASMPASPSQSP